MKKPYRCCRAWPRIYPSGSTIWIAKPNGSAVKRPHGDLQKCTRRSARPMKPSCAPGPRTNFTNWYAMRWFTWAIRSPRSSFSPSLKVHGCGRFSALARASNRSSRRGFRSTRIILMERVFAARPSVIRQRTSTKMFSIRSRADRGGKPASSREWSPVAPCP